jgi:signal peptidase
VLARVGAALAAALVAAVALATLAPRALGLEGAGVISGSMDPVLPEGALVWTADVEPADLRVGDVVVFSDPEGPGQVVHRIVGTRTTSAGLGFVTKGDANAVADPWVLAPDDVERRVVGGVPYAGDVALALQATPARLAIGGLGLALVLRRLAGRTAARSVTSVPPGAGAGPGRLAPCPEPPASSPPPA